MGKMECEAGIGLIAYVIMLGIIRKRESLYCVSGLHKPIPEKYPLLRQKENGYVMYNAN